MHTMFVRENDRLADIVANQHPESTGEDMYQKTQQLVGAEMEVIAYRE